MSIKLLLTLSVFFTNFSLFAQTVEEELPVITLEAKDGGRLDGSPWSSREIKNRVHAFFYVDPDEKDLNEHVGQALKNKNFDLANYGSIAVINMDATWLPNWALESALKDKQKMYKDTVYVKDFKKVLIKKWKLKDDSSNIIIFGKKGEILYKVMGKASEEEAQAIVDTVEKHLNDPV